MVSQANTVRIRRLDAWFGFSAESFDMNIRNDSGSIETPAEDPPADSQAVVKNPYGGSETILVVEDHESIRRMMVRSLEKQGYKVLSAVNGVDAIQVFQGYSEPIDLLLSDVVMPEMDGVQLAEKLRELAPQMKVLFISGYTEDWNRYFNPSQGNKQLFQKPFSIPDFLAEVRKHLNRIS